MIGKITFALIRREANTYRSHGLSEEDADLYKKLLSSSPNLSPEVRADIEYQLKQIDLEIGCNALEECQAISDEQIAVIKQGWRDTGGRCFIPTQRSFFPQSAASRAAAQYPTGVLRACNRRISLVERIAISEILISPVHIF
jgi:hypothetical protein